MSPEAKMEQKQSQMKGQRAVDEQLYQNNLVYVMPKNDISLAVNRTTKKHYFQTRDYSERSTARCVWNSGTDYVDVSNSYLAFSVAPIAPGDMGVCNFGSGSAMNLIREVKITSRSGVEVCRVEQANLWSKIHCRHNNPKDWIEGQGSAMGFSLNNQDVILYHDQSSRFVIPLKCLAPFFNTQNVKHIPAGLASGMVVEITFEDHRTAIHNPTGVCTGYNIEDIQFNLNQVTLTDAAQLSLNRESAASGLEVVHPNVFTVTNQVGTRTNVNIPIQKAVSQANIVYSVVRDTANITDLTVDSFRSEYPVEKYRYRLGSLNFPNMDIEYKEEAYINSQQVFDKLKHVYKESLVSKSLFESEDGVLCASFERDTRLNLSGLPINNSRICELLATLTDAGVDRTITSFLEYSSITTSYVDNVKHEV